MKIQGKMILASCLSMGLASGAAAYTIDDGTELNPGSNQYIGGGADGSDVFGPGAGAPAFEVFGMNVSSDLSYLYVDVDTNFDDADTSTYDFGDLFISTNGWSMDEAAPYKTDVASTGEQWEYAVDVSELVGGFAPLRDLSLSSIVLSSDLFSSGVRKNQEILAADPVDGELFAGSVETSIARNTGLNSDLTNLSFKIALNDLGLNASASQEIGLRWTMTCANDIVEGSYTVPEPGTLALLGLGLLGLGMRKRVKG